MSILEIIILLIIGRVVMPVDLACGIAGVGGVVG